MESHHIGQSGRPRRVRRVALAAAVAGSALALGVGVTTFASAAPTPVSGVGVTEALPLQQIPESPGDGWGYGGWFDGLEACYDSGSDAKWVNPNIDTYICIPLAGWHLFLHYI